MKVEKIDGYKNIIKEVLKSMKHKEGKKETIFEINRQLQKLIFQVDLNGKFVTNHWNGARFPIWIDEDGEILFDEEIFNKG